MTNDLVDVAQGVGTDLAAERDRATRVARALADLPFGWFWHADPWCRLIDQRRPALAVELGTYNGRSALAQARLLAGWGGRLVCVDTWADGPLGRATRFGRFQTAIEAAGLTNIDPFIGRTRDVAAAWDRGPIDALFVDADHTEDSVLADLHAWWPLLRDGGLFGGDDYGSDLYPGVARAWDAFSDMTGQALIRTAHAAAPFPLVWGVKGQDAPTLDLTPSTPCRLRHSAPCTVCHRALWSDHADDRGRCCFCRGA